MVPPNPNFNCSSENTSGLKHRCEVYHLENIGIKMLHSWDYFIDWFQISSSCFGVKSHPANDAGSSLDLEIIIHCWWSPAFSHQPFEKLSYSDPKSPLWLLFQTPEMS